MIEETDIEKLFIGSYINPKFVESIESILFRKKENENETQKEGYFFWVHMMSGDYCSSRSFDTEEECDVCRRDLIRWIIDLYKYVN